MKIEQVSPGVLHISVFFCGSAAPATPLDLRNLVRARSAAGRPILKCRFRAHKHCQVKLYGNQAEIPDTTERQVQDTR